MSRHSETPQRDGIHGREYVDRAWIFSRKFARLDFTEGAPDVAPPPLVESPLRGVFRYSFRRIRARGPVVAAILRAAAEIGTLAVVRPEGLPVGLALEPGASYLLKTSDTLDLPAVMAMIPDGDRVAEIQAALKAENPEQVVAIRVRHLRHAAPTDCRTGPRRRGGMIHLVFDSHGHDLAVNGASAGEEETAAGQPAAAPRHIGTSCEKSIGPWSKAGIRDEVTLMAFPA